MARCAWGRRLGKRLPVLMCLLATGLLVAEAAARDSGRSGGGRSGGSISRSGGGGGDRSFSGPSRSAGSGRSFSAPSRSPSGSDRSFSPPSRSFGESGISRSAPSRNYSTLSPGGSSRGSSVRPPADFRSSQPRIGNDTGSRRGLGDSYNYSPSRRMSPGSFDRSGSQGFSDASRSGRSGSRDLGIGRPDRTSVDRSPFAGESIARQGSTGSRGLEGMRSPGNRSGVFGDSSSRSGLSGRDSIARQIARPSISDRASRSSLADASGGRGDSISRDSMNRGSTNRRSMDQAPMGRGISRGPITDGAGGDLRGGDSVARQLARPDTTERSITRGTDGMPRTSLNSGRTGRTITRGSESPVARTRDSITRDSTRSGSGITRAPEIGRRTRTSDASDSLTRRTPIEGRPGGLDRVGRDGPVSRSLEGTSRGTAGVGRTGINDRGRPSNSATADALSIRRGADLGRTVTRTPGLRQSIDRSRSGSVLRSGGSVPRSRIDRSDAASRTSFARNAGSQLARSAARSNNVFVAGRHGWANWNGHNLNYGRWGHGGGWSHGGWGHGDSGHHGWHGAVYHGWHGGHHGWYYNDYHWYRPYGWGVSFGFNYYSGPAYVDYGFRYAYPYYGAYWPPAVVYYDYSYPYAYYPPLVYSSVCYTPLYSPVYYAAPVVPVFPSYYYPAYSVMYYYPSLYYAPPATTFGISASWTAQNDLNGDSAPASAGAPDPAAGELPAPETADNTSAAPGDGNLDLGLEALRAGQLERARSYLGQAVSADPNDGVARMVYTAALVADGQYKDASLALRDTLQVWGDVQLKDFYLPSVYGNQQAQTQYLRDLRAFLSDHPERLDSWLLTIWSYAFSGQTDQAASLLAEAKKSWPDDPGLVKLEALVRLG